MHSGARRVCPLLKLQTQSGSGANALLASGCQGTQAHCMPPRGPHVVAGLLVVGHVGCTHAQPEEGDRGWWLRAPAAARANAASGQEWQGRASPRVHPARQASQAGPQASTRGGRQQADISTHSRRSAGRSWTASSGSRIPAAVSNTAFRGDDNNRQHVPAVLFWQNGLRSGRIIPPLTVPTAACSHMAPAACHPSR